MSLISCRCACAKNIIFIFNTYTIYLVLRAILNVSNAEYEPRKNDNKVRANSGNIHHKSAIGKIDI